MRIAHFLDRFIRVGSLIVVDHDGCPHRFGDGGEPVITIRLRDPSLDWRIAIDPSVGTGEGYMEGTLTIEDGHDVHDFLDLVGRNIAITRELPVTPVTRAIAYALRRLHQRNLGTRARRNVAHHYDLSGDLYALFLDSDRQYSCAYFTTPEDSLEAAQAMKKRRLAAKLLLEPGMRVLDIGSGWGGLGLTLAAECEVDVTGLTLSTEQHAVSEERARQAGLSARVRFALRDYRETDGHFDRVVSVGMFEHVGIGYYDDFFRCIHDHLTDDGVAVLHTIGRAEGPGFTDRWIQRYIFPGGYIPALSEVAPAIERAGLWITDIEVMRLQYAETLRHWRLTFQANRANAVALYDERFARMWEYYLAASEMSFRHMDSVVFQIQMAKRRDTVPMSRDYIRERAARLTGEPVAPLRTASGMTGTRGSVKIYTGSHT